MIETQSWPDGDFVAAVINEQSELDHALADIGRTGLHGEEVRVFVGEAGAEALRKLGGAGFLASVRRVAAENVGAADELMHTHEHEAALGHHVVMVRVDDEPTVALVCDILASHQAHDMVKHRHGSYEAWGEGGIAAA